MSPVPLLHTNTPSLTIHSAARPSLCVHSPALFPSKSATASDGACVPVPGFTTRGCGACPQPTIDTNNNIFNIASSIRNESIL